MNSLLFGRLKSVVEVVDPVSHEPPEQVICQRAGFSLFYQFN